MFLAFDQKLLGASCNYLNYYYFFSLLSMDIFHSLEIVAPGGTSVTNMNQ